MLNMSDERIHRHDWENGRCKVCGISQHAAEGELPPAPMSKRELSERLDKIERRIGSAEGSIQAALGILVIILLILLFRGR